MKSISILDYGSGNIRSAQHALEKMGVEVEITSDFRESLESEGLVVPGVGAFGSCMQQLRNVRGDEIIRHRLEVDRPTLGICVGMQVLFSGSDESREDGLAIFAERVEKLDAPVLPHIGWNKVESEAPPFFLEGLMGERFYFVHSYAVTSAPSKARVATSSYGEAFISALELSSLSAVQFHPEKSGDAGLELLRNWVTKS